MASVRIFLLDDSPPFLEAAVNFLGTVPQVAVVGQARSAAAALSKVAELEPDVVLVTLELPETNGLVATVWMKALPRPPRVVILSDHQEPPYRDLAAAVQADGFLFKWDFCAQVLSLLQRLALNSSGSVRPAHPYWDVTDEIVDRRVQEVLQQQRHLAALSADVGLALTRTEAVQEMLQQCLESVVRNLDAAFARVWTLDPTGDTLELQASAGLYTHIDGTHRRVPVGRFKIGLIAQERRPHLTNDILNDPRVGDRDWALREGMVAFAGYPLLADGRTIGVMAMFARRPLNEFALEALGHVADMIALGVERKRSREALRRSEERLRSFISGAQDIIFDMSAEGALLSLNPIFETVTGWPISDWLGKPFQPLLHADDVARGTNLFAQVMTGATPPRFEMRLNARRGGPVVVEITVVPRTEAGAVVGVYGIARDITDRKRLEEQYRQAQKMEAIGRLAGGIAHDFNNLLTVINGYSDFVLGELHAADPLRDSVEQIGKAGERAALLTRQLLAFSRKQVLQSTALDLNALLSDMAKMLGRLIGEDIDLTVRPAADLWRIKGDVGQLEQVVMNLVVNARDAMPTGGQLTIETTNVTLTPGYVTTHSEAQPGEYVLLAISDTGCGMDENTRARIFEPFFTTKDPEEGTGLGLATVFGIVKQSGGHIEVYSEVGLGTTFKVYLPRYRNGAPTGKSHPGLKIVPRGSETVLLAEDEDGVRALIRLVLEHHGYRVLEARHGGEALILSEQHEGTIHLLVTDVIMPNLSGPQLAVRLRVRHPTLKVLFLSGYSDDAIVRHGVLEADTAFLQKPFSPDTLVRKVREVLDNRS